MLRSRPHSTTTRPSSCCGSSPITGRRCGGSPTSPRRSSRSCEELREERRCLVHGDFAPKNILLGRDGAWILDAEVAHVGNPVFDLAFFLVFPLLSALQRPELSTACGAIVEGFLRGYARRAPELLPEPRAVAAHTGAMLLARTDGRSPATFLEPAGVRRAREIGERLLLDPAAPALAPLVASLA